MSQMDPGIYSQSKSGLSNLYEKWEQQFCWMEHRSSVFLASPLLGLLSRRCPHTHLPLLSVYELGDQISSSHFSPVQCLRTDSHVNHSKGQGLQGCGVYVLARTKLPSWSYFYFIKAYTILLRLLFLRTLK